MDTTLITRLKALKARLPASRFSGTTSLRYVYGEYRRLLIETIAINEASRAATHRQVVNLSELHGWMAGATKKNKGPGDDFDLANEAIESAVDELIQIVEESEA